MGTVSLPERVYAMDLLGPVLVVATANRRTLVYDIRNPTNPYRDKESPMRYQSRCVAIFTDMAGFALGSIEGRVGIEYIQVNITYRRYVFLNKIAGKGSRSETQFCLQVSSR
jgi:mRNA export factor